MERGFSVLIDGYRGGWSSVLFRVPPGYGDPVRWLGRFVEATSSSRVVYVVPIGSVSDFLEDYGYVPSGSSRSMFFGGESIVSSLDLLLLCLLRGCPISDPSYREVVRGHIFSSFIYFDEVHLGVPSGTPFYSGAVLAAYSLYRLGVPLVYRGGSLPTGFVEDFLGIIGSRGGGVVVDVVPPCSECIGRRQSLFSRYGVDYVSIDDREFFEWATSVEWRYSFSERESIGREITDSVESGRRVVRIVESINDAISEYENYVRVLGEDRVGLVHERLTPSDRRIVFEKLSRGGIDLLVATPCIEYSSSILGGGFDYLYTDVPLKYSGGIVPRIDSIIVRTGFVGGEKSSSGEVVFVGDTDYPGLSRELYDLFTRRGLVNPRLPLMGREEYRGWRGYLWLLDKFYLEHIPVSSIERFQRDITSVFTSTSSREFFEDVCSFLGYFYIPLLPNPEDLGISWDNLLSSIDDYIIYVDYRVVKKKLRWFFGDEGFVYIVFQDERGDLFVDSFELDRVSNWLSSCSGLGELFYSYKVQALVLRNDLYRVEKGFV